METVIETWQPLMPIENTAAAAAAAAAASLPKTQPSTECAEKSRPNFKCYKLSNSRNYDNL